MKTLILGAACVTLLTIALFYKPQEQGQNKRIGILVPIEHQAMNEILLGFKEQIGDDVTIEIQNSQGDLNIQLAMVEKFARQNMSLVATIGTDSSLMAISRLPDCPIIGMDVTDQVHQELSPHFTGIKESRIEPSFIFIKELFPHTKKIAMIYSASDKNCQMVRKFSEIAIQNDVNVQEIMVQSMAELYVLAKAMDRDVDVIFIAKDHLVASGAPILAQVATEFKIPFVSSDEGSVHCGATLALGNREKDIGRKGAEIAKRLLLGEKPFEISMEPIPEMTVFVDTKKCRQIDIDTCRIKNLAAQFQYAYEEIQGDSRS